jgi:hypothetical protein
MNNPIEDMRERLREQFRGAAKPLKGLSVSSVFRPTANDMPRLPQSRIPEPKPRYDRPGRPSREAKPEPQLFRKKPRDIFGGWL